MKSIISKLPRAEYGWGDWHDKPLRWLVTTGTERQKFSIREHARLYASIRKSVTSEQEAFRIYAAS